MRRSIVPSILVVFATLALLIAPGWASPTAPQFLDFSGGTGGSVSYTPAPGNTLDINGAPISLVVGFYHSGQFSIVGGMLDIVTGGCVAGCWINKNGTSFDSFADGGSIEITGSIPSLGIGPGSVLMQGFFSDDVNGFRRSCTLTFSSFSSGQKTTGGLNGCLDVTDLNSTLMTALGFPPFKTGNGYLAQMFLDLTLSLGTFTGTVKSSDILIQPTPEPGTLGMLGAGLLLAGNLARRKLLLRNRNGKKTS